MEKGKERQNGIKHVEFIPEMATASRNEAGWSLEWRASNFILVSHIDVKTKTQEPVPSFPAFLGVLAVDWVTMGAAET